MWLVLLVNTKCFHSSSFSVYLYPTAVIIFSTIVERWKFDRKQMDQIIKRLISDPVLRIILFVIIGSKTMNLFPKTISNEHWAGQNFKFLDKHCRRPNPKQHLSTLTNWEKLAVINFYTRLWSAVSFPRWWSTIWKRLFWTENNARRAACCFEACTCHSL